MNRRASAKPSVLLTNIWLGGRSGTVVVTRDFALGLARRGWRVAIYSPQAASADEELARATMVVSNLDDLTWSPDLIHAHQHPTLTPVMMRFPETPIVQFRHDATAWHDESQRFERIRLHVAVDEACREAIVADTGLSASQTPILPNAVDLGRCVRRPALPRSPGKVLIVANRRGEHVPLVRSACEAAGLEVSVVGYGVGRPSMNLEAEMASADIVVGAARIALEAIAIGCTALVCDVRGFAGLATTKTFDAWRAWNFGFRLLQGPVTPQAVAEALAGYDADDAAQVCDRVRNEASLEPALDRLETLYRSVLDQSFPPVDAERQASDMAAYLARWLPMEVERSPFAADLHRWRAQALTAQARLDGLVQELGRRGMTVTFQTGGQRPDERNG